MSIEKEYDLRRHETVYIPMFITDFQGDWVHLLDPWDKTSIVHKEKLQEVEECLEAELKRDGER